MCLPSRAALSCGPLVALVALLAACTPPPSVSPVRDAVQAAALSTVIADFKKNPTAAHWKSLHAAMPVGPLTARDLGSIVDALTRRAVPDRILNATVVDLATIDWGGAVRLVHDRNLWAKNDRSPQAAIVVRNSARVAWLLLAIRANYARDFVDLSNADLRSRTPMAGQSTNLSNVDFTRSELSAAIWRGATLDRARFGDTKVDGALQCAGCSFGNGRRVESATLVDGAWVLR